MLGKRMFLCRKTYVSTSENIRLREGKRTHQTDVPKKTRGELVNFFHSFEKPFLFRIFQDEIYLNYTIITPICVPVWLQYLIFL